MSKPVWYKQLDFSIAQPISIARERGRIPGRPGCYVFTETSGILVPESVLYVGMALDLRERLQIYFFDYTQKDVPKDVHKGGAFIWDARKTRSDQRVFVRWTIYGDPRTLEASLIDYLNPQCNSRYETGGFADDEGLDKRYTA